MLLTLIQVPVLSMRTGSLCLFCHFMKSSKHCISMFSARFITCITCIMSEMHKGEYISDNVHMDKRFIICIQNLFEYDLNMCSVVNRSHAGFNTSVTKFRKCVPRVTVSFQKWIPHVISLTSARYKRFACVKSRLISLTTCRVCLFLELRCASFAPVLMVSAFLVYQVLPAVLELCSLCGKQLRLGYVKKSAILEVRNTCPQYLNSFRVKYCMHERIALPRP